MDKLASIVEYYLPVFIPVFLTIISVLAGVVTKRIRLTLGDLFKIHSDLVLGLFSFVIWALVAYQQTGRIDLNADSGISLIRVVLLLFGNVTLLIAGLIILSIKWDQWAGPEPRWSAKNWENAVNGANFPQVRFRISGGELGGAYAEERDDALLQRIKCGLERLHPAVAGPQVVALE